IRFPNLTNSLGHLSCLSSLARSMGFSLTTRSALTCCVPVTDPASIPFCVALSALITKERATVCSVVFVPLLKNYVQNFLQIAITQGDIPI
ncbi:TPA: hypothetical protein ACP4A1_004407, partial [Yersinia enterocolitica]